MPNWCSNYVVFSSKVEEKLHLLDDLFHPSEEGQIPDFVTDPDGYLFEVQWDNPTLNFESKWAPPINTLQQIANKFELDFVCDYSEPGNGVFGRYIYKDKVLTDVCLDMADFDLYTYSEETEKYWFEDAWWDSDEEIKELLLERKIQQHGTENR